VTRVGPVVDALAAAGANLDERDPGRIVDRGLRALVSRGIVVRARQVYRVRDRIVLRYYQRTIDHLVHPSKRTSRAH
jgi:hypothetical protein